MRQKVLFFLISILFFMNCESAKNPIISDEVTETGKIIVTVVWPKVLVGKITEILRDAPDKITVFLYLSGEEVTQEDLKHEGSRGTAELTVAAQSGYRLEIVAFDESFKQVLYTGFKDNITVLANTVITVEIIMFDAAPILYPSEKTGDDSYILSWSKVPLAVSYMVEESSSPKFISGDFLDDMKLSSTVYTGSDTTKVFTEKIPGSYYYCVFAVTLYGDSYTASPDGVENWDFYISINYGAISNIISVQSGATGSMKIDIPWPTK